MARIFYRKWCENPFGCFQQIRRKKNCQETLSHIRKQQIDLAFPLSQNFPVMIKKCKNHKKNNIQDLLV